MKKLLIAIAAISFIAVSCENTTSQKQEVKKTQMLVVDEITAINLVDFDSLVENFAGKKISFSGTVDHVCKHGGQKMFIVDENSDARVKVTPNEDIAAFNTDLVGETVKITGIVEEMRVDEDYLKEWEEEVKQGTEVSEGEGKHHGNGEGNHESADAEDHEEGKENLEMQEELEQIAKMRKRVEESEKGYLAFYSVLAIEYKVYKMH